MSTFFCRTCELDTLGTTQKFASRSEFLSDVTGCVQKVSFRDCCAIPCMNYWLSGQLRVNSMTQAWCFTKRSPVVAFWSSLGGFAVLFIAKGGIELEAHTGVDPVAPLPTTSLMTTFLTLTNLPLPMPQPRMRGMSWNSSASRMNRYAPTWSACLPALIRTSSPLPPPLAPGARARGQRLRRACQSSGT